MFNTMLNRKISYQDILGTPSKQTEAIKILKIIEKIWKRKLKDKKNEKKKS
jgi:hypothetical protein